MMMMMMMMMMMSYHNGGGVYDVRPFIFCLPYIQFSCVCQTGKGNRWTRKNCHLSKQITAQPQTIFKMKLFNVFFCSKMNTCYLINEYLSEDFVLLHPTCKTNESSETSGPTETREAWDPSENSQTSKSSDTTKLLSFALNCCSDPERLLWHCDMLKSGLPGLKLRIIRQELLSALTITQQK